MKPNRGTRAQPRGRKSSLGTALAVTLALAACKPSPPAAEAPASTGQTGTETPPPPPVIALDQGAGWTAADRLSYYQTDQGSKMIPYTWLSALTASDGKPFLHGSLERYGYLPYPEGEAKSLPLGFTLAADGVVGMNCAACHTREIEVGGQRYRMDGGPAIADFQSFLADLDAAVAQILNDGSRFDSFAVAVLGPQPDPSAVAALRAEVADWYLPYSTIVQRSLPDPGWGPSRLDAVAMIFNRLTGLDIGPPPSYIIEENILRADAPVRYPFLWNAARQDFTQWPGFSANGNALLGLSRNLGEVYGVFAHFQPQATRLGRIDYLAQNSANFAGLQTLEALIWKLEPPRWPWPLDQTKVAAGAKIYQLPNDQGGCVGCHGIQKGEFRSLEHETWATPIQDVGTDTREAALLNRTALSGVLAGARVPFGDPVAPEEKAFTLLGLAVAGTIIQHSLRPEDADKALSADTAANVSLPDNLQDLNKAFLIPAAADAGAAVGEGAVTGGAKYESRVLQGIWAAAPYLHNGSVPTLRELLKPAADRVKAFPLGPQYDLVNVGLASTQTRFDYTLTTTGCDQLDSGNSNCGHEFGTALSETDKEALLEFLKSL